MVKDEAQLLLAHTYTIETIKLLKSGHEYHLKMRTEKWDGLVISPVNDFKWRSKYGMPNQVVLKVLLCVRKILTV